MIRQFVTNEIQNQSITPFTFLVADDTLAAKKAAEALAYAKYFSIMSIAVQSAVTYHGCYFETASAPGRSGL